MLRQAEIWKRTSRGAKRSREDTEVKRRFSTRILPRKIDTVARIEDEVQSRPDDISNLQTLIQCGGNNCCKKRIEGTNALAKSHQVNSKRAESDRVERRSAEYTVRSNVLGGKERVETGAGGW